MKLSVGRDPKNLRTFEAIDVGNFEKLAPIITKSNYSLGVFKDSTRNLDSFQSAEAIGLDFDAGMSLDEAKEAFKDFNHIIATTKSHQIEKKGLVADRFRVILQLDSPITDRETFEATWFDLASKFPACDKACKDASRFFYPSKSIESVNTKGKKVTPTVRAIENDEPWQVVDYDGPNPTTPEWSKGKLAKVTKEFLNEGKILPEGRNNTVHKVARDLNQNLYSFEEASDLIMGALETHDILANDFDEREVQTTIRSAFSKEAKHPPRVEKKAFNWRQIGVFMKEAKPTTWIIDGLLSDGGMSVIAGPPKSGKSTLVRQMAKAVCQGGAFLGRKAIQGGVFHIALEEQEETLKDQYGLVGIKDTDPLYLHVGGVYEQFFLEDLTADLILAKPKLLIIDTLFLLARVESANDYSQVNAAMTPYRKLARDTGTHVLFVHHTRKGGNGGAESIAGSTAIHGAVDCALMVSQIGNRRRIETSQRGGKPFPRTNIEFDAATQTYSLGKEVEEFE